MIIIRTKFCRNTSCYRICIKHCWNVKPIWYSLTATVLKSILFYTTIQPHSLSRFLFACCKIIYGIFLSETYVCPCGPCICEGPWRRWQIKRKQLFHCLSMLIDSLISYGNVERKSFTWIFQMLFLCENTASYLEWLSSLLAENSGIYNNIIAMNSKQLWSVMPRYIVFCSAT